MNIYEHPLYQEDVKRVAELELPWEKLANAGIAISGATGLLGSFLVDVLLWRNLYWGQKCHILALGRHAQYAKSRFSYGGHSPFFTFISRDMNEPLGLDCVGDIDYVLHLASHTHPVAYAKDPIGTITTNIIGLKNMLDFSVKHHAKRFAFASSNEIYGENRGDQEFFGEAYCGYIDCNTVRAGYPESKRCGEALCQAYLQQKGLDVVIPRFTRSYGPTMLKNDSKAISQFIKKAVAGEDIVLKSEGNQYYSYTYVSDAIAGLLTVILLGKTGEAYNIASPESDIRLKEAAAILAKIANTKVVFELPDEVEKSGYSKATKARLNGEKIKSLGWNPRYDMETGLKKTVLILRSQSDKGVAYGR